MLPMVGRTGIVALSGLLLLTGGCSKLESEEAREVARATQQTVSRGIDGASRAADRAAKETKAQLDEVDLEKVHGAWDAVVERLDRPEPRPSSEPADDPLADVATAITCDEARERCTITAELAARARQHASRAARQLRVSPATAGGVRGVRIDAIDRGTLTERVGLRTGDVVTHVNGMAVGSPQDAMLLYMQVRSARQFVVEYRRGDDQRTLRIDVV